MLDVIEIEWNFEDNFAKLILFEKDLNSSDNFTIKTLACLFRNSKL